MHRHVLPEFDEGVDGLAGQLRYVRFLGVVTLPVRELLIEKLLHARAERQHRRGRHARMADGAEAVHQFGAGRIVGIIEPHRDEHQQPRADQFRRHERQRRDVVLERRVPADRAGQRGHDRGVLAERLGGILGLVQGHADAHHRAEVLRPEGESGDHPEVAAAAPQRPEQVRVLVGRGLDDLAAGQHDLQRDELIAGQPVLAGEPADPAAQGQTGNARF